MLSEDTLRAAVRAAGIEAGSRFDAVTSSTNSVAMELAAAGAPEWTVVAAGHQTAGRGRLGRTWEDEPGQGLLFSFVLRPPLSPDRTRVLPLLAGAAMARACRESAGADVWCKWPNDLVIGAAKVGGILVESLFAGEGLGHMVVGIGVNLDGGPPGVAGAGGVDGVAPGALLTAFLLGFRRRYRPESAAFARDVVSEYRRFAVTLGRRVRATKVGGGDVEGLATDVDEDGNLLVETPYALEAVGFGDVAHLDG